VQLGGLHLQSYWPSILKRTSNANLVDLSYLNTLASPEMQSRLHYFVIALRFKINKRFSYQKNIIETPVKIAYAYPVNKTDAMFIDVKLIKLVLTER